MAGTSLRCPINVKTIENWVAGGKKASSCKRGGQGTARQVTGKKYEYQPITDSAGELKWPSYKCCSFHIHLFQIFAPENLTESRKDLWLMGDESIWLLREMQKMKKKVTAFKREVGAFFAGLKVVDK